MTHAIRFHAIGGPEVLRWERVVVPAPGPGEALVRHTAVGVNFIDTYHRTGLYPLALPSGLGMEAAGVVEAVGEGVAEVEVGQRVAYACLPVGAYAEARTIRADRLVPLPPGVDDRTAAAALLKGMTAQYLLRSTFRVGPGHAVLVHAAAGGVGLLACQWARHLGATVIGVVSSEAKAELALANGCHHVVVAGHEDLVARVRELTGGEGVHVVYDSVGKDTWDASLDCLRRRGMMVSFGNASGPVPPIQPLVLSRKGSLYLTRPTLMDYTATRRELLECAGELFEVLESGAVRVRIHATYPLAAAASAHRDLESRRTAGSLLLLP
ncbi:MAG TPA: quinone oxidoreductase [Thermoanaerobaculaceae bacterium]|nr:quinone oxidoreductase [Thermoanaerobaculaceae bacterium]HRS16805.1 quinone oxidoreductase [Thermoanaerobaculaceae bacterium]